MKKFKSSFERLDARGQFNEYTNTPQGWRSINGGRMKKGAVMGNHYHKHAATMFFLLSGAALVVAQNVKAKKSKPQKITLRELEGVLIEPYENHVWKFTKSSTFILLKSKAFDPKREDIHPGKVLIPR